MTVSPSRESGWGLDVFRGCCTLVLQRDLFCDEVVALWRGRVRLMEARLVAGTEVEVESAMEWVMHVAPLGDAVTSVVVFLRTPENGCRYRGNLVHTEWGRVLGQELPVPIEKF